MDRTTVRLPGDHFAPSVAGASDKRLEKCMEKDLAATRSILGRHGVEPGPDGLAPAAWLRKAERNRRLHRGLRVIEHQQRRVLAIRAECEDRRQQREAEAAERSREARQRLLALLEGASTQADELRAQAEAAVAVTERVERIADDIRLLSIIPKLRQEFDALQNGVLRAAEVLDQPVPELGELPELPNAAEVERLLSLLRQATSDARRVPSHTVRDAQDAASLGHDLR